MSTARDPLAHLSTDERTRYTELLRDAVVARRCGSCEVLSAATLVDPDATIAVCQERLGRPCGLFAGVTFARADGRTPEELAADEELERLADRARKRRLEPWVRLEDLLEDLRSREESSELRRLWLNEWTTPADPSRPSLAERDHLDRIYRQRGTP